MSLAKDSQKLKTKKFRRGHTELNHGPIDLQSIALPLSYTPSAYTQVLSFEEQVKVSEK